MEETQDKNTTIEDAGNAHSKDDNRHTKEEEQEQRPTCSESTSNDSPRRVTRSQTSKLPARSQRADKPPAKKRKMKDNLPPPIPEASTSAEPFPLDPQLCPNVSEPADVIPQPLSQVTGPMSSQYTFLEQPAFPEQPFQGERRGPRTRIAPPVPVPNLTKRSRGRRVPIGAAGPERERSQNGRMYICKVQDCGKCFNRGEHLKRHVRSIHTHDKPFQCTYPSCEKYFSRHDNLLQHQKIHRDYHFSQEPDPLGGTLHRVQQSPRVDDMPMASSMSVILPHPFATITTFPASAEPVGFSAHMAVSSLRTELPAAAEDFQTQMSSMPPETQFAHISLPSHFHPPPSNNVEATTPGAELQT